MQKFRVLGLGLLIVTAGCTDDRQVVGEATGATGGLPGSTGGQTGTHLSAGGNSAGTGSGPGGTQATSGAGATSLAGSGGNSGGAGSGLGGTRATGGVGGKTTAGSGGNSAGASAVSGGTKATGGTAGAAGTIADETCTAGPVQLLLTTNTPSAYCLESCGGFISILTSDNRPFASLNADPCTLTPLCSTCSAPICTDVYCGPVVMSRSSAGANWQGEYHEASTCGQNVACSHGRCITSGHYIARFCATAASSTGTCDPYAAQTCIDVPFDFPTTTTVQAVLPAVSGAGGTSASGGSTSTGGRTGTGGSGTQATGGSVGSGGTQAIGGSLASGGSTSTGTTSAGGVCNSGCIQEGTSTDSPYCDVPNATLVCWGPFPSDLSSIMTANGCTDVPTGAVRYCCPTAILTQCQ